MLFILEETRNVTLWMKNVHIPLDMIFIDENLTIMNIEVAHVELPETEDINLKRYYSSSPVLYVVETNAGFCTDHGIEAGDKVTITFS